MQLTLITIVSIVGKDKVLREVVTRVILIVTQPNRDLLAGYTNF